VRLLDVTQRPFILREIARRFWQDPAFPLVPSETEVRRAIFEALELPPPDGWEIVGPAGEILTITDQSLLALGAMDQMVRPKSVALADKEEARTSGRCQTMGAHRNVEKRSTSDTASGSSHAA
jgi:hypothetical protein